LLLAGGIVPSPHGSKLAGEAHIVPRNLLYTSSYSPGEKVVTQKGKDVYEVLWSVEVTVARVLKKERVEDIKHIEINWQAVT
jgi:hypothetical protein